jgi:hypothetical protein
MAFPEDSTAVISSASIACSLKNTALALLAVAPKEI